MKRGLFLILLVSAIQARADVFQAAERADLATLRKEVTTSAQANAKSAAGETLLIKAADSGTLKAVEFLLSKGADVNAVDAAGNSALFYAVAGGREDIALLLIGKKADLKKIYGEKKENILFEAARLGAVKVIQAVAKKDKSLVNQTNVDGDTALIEAVRSSQSEAARALLKAGARVDAKNKAGKTAASFADPATDAKMLKVLGDGK